MEIIEGLPQFEGSDFVFSTTGRTAVSGFSRSKSDIDRAVLALMREEAETRGDDPADVKTPAPWTLHDIRRSVATYLQQLGVRLEVTESLLNHISGARAGIVGVYQKYGFEPEKRAAMDAWSRRLAAIMNGETEAKVVAFVRK